jgi:tRNA uridine 5-carboxymethylaminomethyl modification enzyme
MDAEIVVVGLGHAGIEAALSAARMGRAVVAIVPSRDRIGRMSCNPAIGGSAKSHLVREVDALGGQMALAADATGIHFRRLNASRGAAVHATRVLCDRDAYSAAMQAAIEAQPGLEVVEGQAVGLWRRGARVEGVRLASGATLRAAAVILTTGTFLEAVLHTGERTTEGGRVGEEPAHGISADLRALGLELGRFKTGTPPRLLARTIDFAATEVQPGDVPPRPMSFWTRTDRFPALPQRPCHLTYTNPATHAVVRSNLDRSPLFQGRIQGRGPRYCPSLEDKVVRFAGRDRHAVFLEPEGVDASWIYPAGLSTSLPPDAQEEFLRTISGLEGVEVALPGYAVEYDFVPAHQLTGSLAVGETGLFLAGQINGTSGYEEAAAQGLWAGVNAARAVRAEGPFRLEPTQAHLAVLVEELTRHRQAEPFRMFTSRAEERLRLREGNADLRLAATGRGLGLLTSGQGGQAAERGARIAAEVGRLANTRVNPDRAVLATLSEAGLSPIDKPSALRELLARPETHWKALRDCFPEGAPDLTAAEAEEVEAEVKYAGYVARADRERARSGSQDGTRIPPALVFDRLAGLSNEVREALTRGRPGTLGEARRLPGMTAAAFSILSVQVLRHVRQA